MAIVKRQVKGSALTYAELDGNFDHLTAADTVLTSSVSSAQSDINNHIADSAGAHADSAITFTPAGTGAVASTVQSKLRERISVKDFGAVGDGVTDDTVAIQAAITAAGATQILVFNQGSYLCGEITFHDGISWVGYGATLKCPASATGTNSWIRASSTEQSGKIEGLTFDYQTNTNQRHILILGNNSHDWEIINCTFKNMNGSPALRADWITAVSGDGYITIKGCKFTNGTSAGAIGFYAKLPSMNIRNITIADTEIIDCGSSLIAVTMNYDGDDAGAGRYGAFVGTRVTNVRMVGNGTGIYGTIPTELWGHDDVVVTGCTVEDGGNGIQFSWCRDVTCSNNVIKNQTNYAHELGNSERVVFSNEVIIDCKSYVLETTTLYGSNNVTIANNIIQGTGEDTYTNNTWLITASSSATVANDNWTIIGNQFVSAKNVQGCISCGYGDNWIISNNSYTRLTEYDAVTFVRFYTESASSSNNAVCENNIVTIIGDYTTNTPSYNNKPFIFSVSATYFSNIVIKNNYVLSLTDEMAGVGFGFVGLSAAAYNALGSISVESNKAVGKFYAGIQINLTNDYLTVENNNFRKATFLDGLSGYTNLGTGTIYINKINTYTASAVPTLGTYFVGDRVINSSSTVGQPKAWACTVAGTGGTLTGVTGTITTGTTALTVNDASALKINQYITIVGVTGTKQIREIDGLEITISSNANASVTDAAVAYSAFTLTSEGNL